MESLMEEIGVYKGMIYVIKIGESGHRCGYVKIEDDKLFERYDEEYKSDINISELMVHGGITFVQHINIGDMFLPPGNWIGFDAMHFDDGFDYETAKKYFNRKKVEKYEYLNFGREGIIRTKEYMINECKGLIDQIKKEEKMKYDYRYFMFDPKRMYLAHRHFFHETDEQAIEDIKEIEDATGLKCMEVEKSLNEAECAEGNEYYKSIWEKE